MKLIDVLVTVLLVATTAAAAALPSLSASLANSSALVDTTFSGSAAPNFTIQKAKDPWGFMQGWGFMCVHASAYTISTTYDDYWHSMDIFCHYLADNQIKFEYDEVFDAADSLCDDERCFFVQAKNICHDPKHRIVTLEECIVAFQFPFYQKSRPRNDGPCILAGKRVAGASVKEPTRCWIFSSEVRAPLW
ncbi:hypothetical protein CKM354_001245500 [Cercospora kikuchii]|uniref:Uncharacterized protein n=1 Tax=Cercospora kikuchii TaxID=84275 RepID=A0A9P3FM39_9PEZI|nr:uncharacterized protein CKM354_001245500 [Cercospora kikuchii]GIZ49425.1 hypothetical protein CKM354_001245500 [Cercospora kikuchii]